MSIQFDKEIISRNNVTLKMNFSGFTDGITDTSSISMTFYAYDNKSGKPIFTETIGYDGIQEIYNQLNSVSIIRDNSKTVSDKFIELTGNHDHVISAILNLNAELLGTLLSKVDDDEKQELLLSVLTESEITNLNAAILQTSHEQALKDLKYMLDLEDGTSIVDEIFEITELSAYHARQPEKIFQNWIEKNIWVLGIDYIKKHSARQIGLNSESDLIMETTDGFIDLIELKRPKFELFNQDRSHNSWYPSIELSKVIGQCLQYLKVLDEYKLVLEKAHGLNILRPRIKVIVGRTTSFNNDQHEALRMLNSTLNHIQIISYDYIYVCGEILMNHYK